MKPQTAILAIKSQTTQVPFVASYETVMGYISPPQSQAPPSAIQSQAKELGEGENSAKLCRTTHQLWKTRQEAPPHRTCETRLRQRGLQAHSRTS